MNPVNKNDIKIGMLLKNSWGATMRHHEYWQVISIKGSIVELGNPNCKFEGNQEGHSWIESPSDSPALVSYAKFVRSGLKLCCRIGSTDWQGKDQSKKVRDSHWYFLYPATIGQKDHFYGD